MSNGITRLGRVFDFMVLLAVCIAAPARGNIESAQIFNNNAFLQTSTAAPAAPDSAFFTFVGTFYNSGDYDAVVCNYPGPASVNVPIFGTVFLFQEGFTTQTALHNKYTFGNYTYTATNSITHATAQGTVNYLADTFPPAIPALTSSSYTQLHNMIANQSFDLFFNSWTLNPATTSGTTQISIDDVDNGYANVYNANGLPRTTTDRVLPANTLLPGHNYRLVLGFSNSNVGMDGAVFTTLGFDNRTQIFFSTAGVPEPGTLGLLAVGVVGVMRQRIRQKEPCNGQ